MGVPWALLLQAKGPDELLALSGLHSRADSTWRHHVFLITNNVRAHTQTEMKMPRPLPDMRRLAAEGIRKLVVDTDFVDGES